MESWLDQHVGKPMPSAIFCANDSSAIGCIDTLSSRGLRVPGDVSLCGFDDSIAARACVPQLTTVRQPLRAMGMRAVEALLERIQQHQNGEPPPEATNVVVPVEVVSRGSVQPPRRPRPTIVVPR